MLSDDSSSDSETGRFKDSSEKRENTRHESSTRRDNKTTRHTGDQRYHRELDRNDRHRSSRHSPVRHRSSRHSPTSRRRYSRDRSAEYKRPPDRSSSSNNVTLAERHSYERRRSPPRHHRSHSDRNSSRRSYSKEKKIESRRSKISPIHKSDSKSRFERSISNDRKLSNDKRVERSKSKDRNEYKSSLSIVRRPTSPTHKKKVIPSSDEILEVDDSDEAQPPSYYNTLPIVEEVVESSVSDSSDEEGLRAKLLDLEKQLVKSKKKKHKKKHKKSKNKDRDTVEVTSTTDIDKNINSDEVYIVESDVPEVSSTQTKAPHKSESSEEGEITSDNDNEVNVDSEDLRHKLNRDKYKVRDVCGPALPPHLSKRLEKLASPDTEGPELPPHLRNSPKNIGPSISGKMREVLAESDSKHRCEESDDDNGIGPLPAGSEKWSEAHQQLEERALDMKIHKLDGHKGKSEKYKREEWMTELPEAKAKILGLEARQFRAKAGPDMSDRSSWTDLPEDKERKARGLPAKEDKKAELAEEARSKYIADRDADQEHAVKKHKKKHKREESLLDLHQKKLKKKKKKDEKDEERPERRPFSRDVDLQVNRFDEAQKQSIIKKAQHLDSRFSSGEAKFLAPNSEKRSSWTDLPEDKERKARGLPAKEDKKAELAEEARSKYIADRDADQEHAVKKHKKKHKREESLLDLHQKKLKKKKKKDEKDEERPERRPFSRDVDLQVNRFDEAQKQSIIKKAQHLDSRFSSGEAKFLAPNSEKRSSWTDLPEDKERKARGLPAKEDKKAELAEEARSKYIADRDADQEHAVKKHKKKHKREESLLDLHQKKLKKKKKKDEKDEERPERRPFSRDVDLQVNRFDEAQKQSIIKKAQHLDSRFSSGEAKFL